MSSLLLSQTPPFAAQSLLTSRKNFLTATVFFFCIPKRHQKLAIEIPNPRPGKTSHFGVYPQLFPERSAEACADAKKQLSGAIDPSVEKKVNSKSDQTSLETVAREWHSKQKPTWSIRHAEDVVERLEKNIFPFLGSLQPNDITPPQLLAVLRKVEGRGSVEVAHRVRGICSQVFRYAVAIGLAERDPATDLIGALQTRPITPRAAINDLKSVGALMRAIEGFTGTYIVKSALQLAALTFCRPGEIRAAEWSEFDFEENLSRIPATKMKMHRDHIVPLSTQALEVLHKLQQLSGESRYLFPSIRTPERPIRDVLPWSQDCGAWGMKSMKCALTGSGQWQAPCSMKRAMRLTA